MRRKQLKVLGTVVLGIFIIRIFAPYVFLSFLNHRLKDFSPMYGIHIGDLDLAFYKMSYTFEEIELRLKKTNQIFLKISEVETQLSWRDLFKGRIATVIVINGASADLEQSFAVLVKDNMNQSKDDAEKVRETLFPVQIQRLQLSNSKISVTKLNEQTLREPWTISEIEMMASNLLPQEPMEKTFLTVNGTLLDNAKIKVAGEARLGLQPKEWSLDCELSHFALPELNPLLLHLVPMTFEKGILNLYLEIRSRKGEILGYAKPFFKDFELMGDDLDFKDGAKQFIYEALAATAQILLQDRESSSVATQIEFGTVKGEFKVNTIKAIKSAIEHGYGKNLEQQVDEKLDLPDESSQGEK